MLSISLTRDFALEPLDELFTEDEIKELERREIEYQKQQKKRKEGERDKNMRERELGNCKILLSLNY